MPIQESEAFVIAPVITPRPAAGYRNVVRVDHPLTGTLDLLVTSASWNETNSYNFTPRAYTPNIGPKQEGLHSRGTKELTWRVDGDLTTETLPILNLALSEARGVSFNQIYMQQGSVIHQFSNQTGYSIPWTSFSLTGSPDSPITFSLEGRSILYPVPSFTILEVFPNKTPIPSWFSGNDYVTDWTFSHSVPLSAVWSNSSSPFPAYYRPGASEINMGFGTGIGLMEHTLVRFGLGGIQILEGLVMDRGRVLGDQTTHHSYTVNLRSARVADLNVYNSAVSVSLRGGPLDAY